MRRPSGILGPVPLAPRHKQVCSLKTKFPPKYLKSLEMFRGKKQKERVAADSRELGNDGSAPGEMAVMCFKLGLNIKVQAGCKAEKQLFVGFLLPFPPPSSSRGNILTGKNFAVAKMLRFFWSVPEPVCGGGCGGFAGSLFLEAGLGQHPQ